MSYKVDLHAHWFHPDFVAQFDALSGRKAFPVHAPNLAHRIADLDASGINVQVIGLGHNQPYFADQGAALGLARFANDLYAAELPQYGGRLKAFGAIALPHVQASIDEAKRCLDDLGFYGIGVGTTALGRSLDDPEFDPLWAELDRRGTTVFVHPVGAPEAASAGLDAFFLGPKIGGPQEMTTCALHLTVGGVTTRFPNIKWVMAAMGGTIAFVYRRFEEITECLNQTQWLANDPKAELRKLFYDTALSDDPRVLDFHIEMFGADNLVLGTDSERVPTAEWIRRLERPGVMDAKTWDRILGGTAKEKLGL